MRILSVRLLVVFSLLLAALSAEAEDSSTRTVTIKIQNVGVDPHQPVANVRVTLYALETGQPLATWKTLRKIETNREGVVVINFPVASLRGGVPSVRISGADGLVIYEPTDGQLDRVGENLVINLLPRGSRLLFKTPQQIEALVRRLSAQNSLLMQEKKDLKGALTALQNAGQRPVQSKEEQLSPSDLLAAQEQALADDYGITPDELRAHMHAWAIDVEAHKDSTNRDRLALAEFNLKHYEQAGEQFIDAYRAKRAARVIKDERLRLEAVSDLKDREISVEQAVHAFLLNSNFHKAQSAYEEFASDAGETYQHFRNDDTLWEFWIDARVRAAQMELTNASRETSETAQKLYAIGMEHLEQTLMDLAAGENVARKLPSARVRKLLGTAYYDRALRAPKGESLSLYKRAAEQFRQAFQLFSPSEQEEEWVLTGTELLYADSEIVKLTDGKGTSEFGEEAIKTIHAMLKVVIADPEMSGMAAEFRKIDEAVTSAENGKLNEDEIARVVIERGRALCQTLKEKIATIEDRHEWAQAHITLAENMRSLYKNQTIPQEAVREIADAYRNALTVLRLETDLELWADAELNLATTLLELADEAKSEETAAIYSESEAAFQNALMYFKRDVDANNWALAQGGMAEVRYFRAAYVEGAEQDRLVEKAIEGFRNSMAVWSETDHGEQWALSAAYLGEIYLTQSRMDDRTDAKELVDQARNLLSRSLRIDGDSMVALESAMPLAHDIDFNFAEARRLAEHMVEARPNPVEWINAAEARFTDGDFASCIEAAGQAAGGGVPPGLLLARDVVQAACNWGKGQQKEAARLLNAIDPATLVAKFWNATGDRHYLATANGFRKGRSEWIMLFGALENGNKAQMQQAIAALVQMR